MRAGLFQRIAQAAARLDVERERRRAEMQVEIDQRRALLAIVREQEGRVDGHRRRADTAARAHEGDDAAELGGRLAGLAADIPSVSAACRRCASSGLTR